MVTIVIVKDQEKFELAEDEAATDDDGTANYLLEGILDDHAEGEDSEIVIGSDTLEAGFRLASLLRQKLPKHLQRPVEKQIVISKEWGYE